MLELNESLSMVKQSQKRIADPYDDRPVQSKTITPEQQITNVITALEVTANDRHRPDRIEEIRAAVAQLKDYWQMYQRGELQPTDDKLPF